MISLDRVVCPLDFSAVGQRAFDHAVALARRCDASITAVHVAPPKEGTVPRRAGSPVVLDPGGTSEGMPPSQAADAMDWLADTARRTGVEVDPVVVEGNAVRSILRYASSPPADLLVIGTHGSGGFERLVMGSVAERIVRKAACPVLTVSPEVSELLPPPDPGFFDRIVCAVDFSDASLRALQYAQALAEGPESEVAVVHVLDSPASSILFPRRAQATASDPEALLAAQNRLESLLPSSNERRGPRPKLELRVGRPHEQILHFARERDAQVVVMGVHGRGRGLVERFFLGSVTSHIMRGAACPVLSVREATPALSPSPGVRSE